MVKPGALALPCDILFERDVAVPLRDGVTIYVDVFRPVGAKPAGHRRLEPLRQAGGLRGPRPHALRAGVPQAAVSGLQKFEGPDPAYWCAQGYASATSTSAAPHLGGRRPLLGEPGWARLLRRHRVAGRAGVVQRQGRHGGHLVARGRPVVHRRRAAASPGRHRPLGGADRHLPLRRMPRRHARHRLHGAHHRRHLRQRPRGGPPSVLRRHPLMNDYWRDKAARLSRHQGPSLCRGELDQHRPQLRDASRVSTVWGRRTSGCASTTRRSGPTSTRTRTTCAASSTATSRAWTTAGRTRHGCASPFSIPAAATWSTGPRRTSRRRALSSCPCTSTRRHREVTGRGVLCRSSDPLRSARGDLCCRRGR